VSAPTAEYPTVAPPELVEELVDQAVDPEAPYGRNPATGRPYTMPEDKRLEIGQRLADARRNKRPPSSARPPGKAKGPAAGKPAAKAAGPDYRTAVLGLAQVPAIVLGVLGRINPRFALDSATITLYSPPAADAIHELALSDARVAAILDKAMMIGPYGAIAGVLLPFVLQIACNHSRIPPIPALGVLGPDELVAAVERMAPA